MKHVSVCVSRDLWSHDDVPSYSKVSHGKLVYITTYNSRSAPRGKSLSRAARALALSHTARHAHARVSQRARRWGRDICARDADGDARQTATASPQLPREPPSIQDPACLCVRPPCVLTPRLCAHALLVHSALVVRWRQMASDGAPPLTPHTRSPGPLNPRQAPQGHVFTYCARLVAWFQASSRVADLSSMRPTME